MPIYAKGTKWRVRVWVRGQRFDRIVEGTKDDARTVEATMRLEHGADRATSRGSRVPTFSQLCAGRYAMHAKATLAAKTWANRQYQLASLIAVLGDVRVDRLTPAHVLGFVNARKAVAQGSTIRDDLKVLSAVLAFGRSKERLPIPRLEMPAVRMRQRSARDRAKAWADADVARLLDACRKHSKHIVDLVEFVADTGVRKGEAIHLQWSSVDLDKAIAWIQPGEDEDGWQPKTEGSTRPVPLTPALVTMLRRRKAAGGTGAVFTTVRKPRRPLASWPQLAFDRAREAAGLDGGPHTLRHSFASRFLRAGGSLFELGRLLGHASQKTTELYAHMVPDHLADAAARVSRVSIATGLQSETVPATVPSARRRRKTKPQGSR